MLKYRKGDLIKAAKTGEVNIIAHQCNCFNNMGKGIAPLIKRAFPAAWEADNSTIKGDKNKLGTYSYADCCGIGVVNLYGQYGWWKRGDGEINTDYHALRKALQSLGDGMRGMERMAGEKIYKIGMPKIGCGLGGGDWGVVSKIIEETMDGLDITIYEL